MSTTALVILAPGFEEIEAITVIDILRRAQFEVTVAGTVDGPITASRETRHLADTGLDEVKDDTFDIVILPGGVGGTNVLKEDERVLELLRRHQQDGKWLAALCAAPSVLVAADVLSPEHRITCHPSIRSEMPSELLDLERRVVVSEKIITSLAAGSAMEFAYTIVEELAGTDAIHNVDGGVYAPSSFTPSL